MISPVVEEANAYTMLLGWWHNLCREENVKLPKLCRNETSSDFLLWRAAQLKKSREVKSGEYQRLDATSSCERELTEYEGEYQGKLVQTGRYPILLRMFLKKYEAEPRD